MNKCFFACFCCFFIASRICSQDVVLKPDSADLKGSAGTFISIRDQPSDKEITERLLIICKMLDRNEKEAGIWWYGWIGFYGTATLGLGAAACFTGKKTTREDMILGAGTTLLGVAGQLIAPVESGYDSNQFAQIRDISNKECLEKLRQAELMLKDQAEKARKGKSWQTHAISGVVNLSSGLITSLGFKRSAWDGIVNFALSTVITETQIWSQPTRAMKDYNFYCSKFGLSGYQSVKRPDFVWYAYAHPGGIGIRLGF